MKDFDENSYSDSLYRYDSGKDLNDHTSYFTDHTGEESACPAEDAWAYAPEYEAEYAPEYEAEYAPEYPEDPDEPCSGEETAAAALCPPEPDYEVPEPVAERPETLHTGPVCRKCGSSMKQGQSFCSQCGTRGAEKKGSFCSNCGTPLADGQAFCGNCGCRNEKAAPKAVAAPGQVPVRQVTRSAAPTRTTSPRTAAPAAAAPVTRTAEKPKRKGCSLILAVPLVLLILFAAFLSMGINPKVRTITMDTKSVTLSVGEGIYLAYTIEPETAAGCDVTWVSSNSGIASVDDYGYLRGLTEGSCTITVTTENGKGASCAVTVESADGKENGNQGLGSDLGEMTGEEQKAVGFWKVEEALNLDTEEVIDCSSYNWVLSLYDDHYGQFGEQGDQLEFTWYFVEVDSDGDYAFVFSDEDVVFYYINDFDEIWLYMDFDEDSYCFTCTR